MIRHKFLLWYNFLFYFQLFIESCFFRLLSIIKYLFTSWKNSLISKFPTKLRIFSHNHYSYIVAFHSSLGWYCRYLEKLACSSNFVVYYLNDIDPCSNWRIIVSLKFLKLVRKYLSKKEILKFSQVKGVLSCTKYSLAPFQFFVSSLSMKVA